MNTIKLLPLFSALALAACGTAPLPGPSVTPGADLSAQRRAADDQSERVLPNKAYDVTFTYQDGRVQTGRWQVTDTTINTTGARAQPGTSFLRLQETFTGKLSMPDGQLYTLTGRYFEDTHTRLGLDLSAEQSPFGYAFIALPNEDERGVIDVPAPNPQFVDQLPLVENLKSLRLTPVTKKPRDETLLLTLTAADGTVTRATWNVGAIQGYQTVPLQQELWGNVVFESGTKLLAKGYKASELVDGATNNTATPGGPNFYVVWLGNAGTQPGLILTAKASGPGGTKIDRSITGTYRSIIGDATGTFVARRR